MSAFQPIDAELASIRRAPVQYEPRRDLPKAIAGACALARGMLEEQELFEIEDGRSPYNTTEALDALLACIQGAAQHLSETAQTRTAKTDAASRLQ
jgi:hypothetical protein